MGINLVAARDTRVPFPHNITELTPSEWKKLRHLLVGNQEDGYVYRDEQTEANKFVPDRPLDKEGSILGSNASLMRVVGQFSLPQDQDTLREVPSVGLHLALKSYLLRGALVEEEVFTRLSFLRKFCDALEKELSKERLAMGEAEKREAGAPVERDSAEGRWRRELEVREKMFENLHQHRSKQSATIQILKDENAKLKGEVEHRDGRIKYLEEEVEVEKRCRLEAQESALSDRLAFNDLQLDLNDERAAHQSTLTKVKALEEQLAFLQSEAGKAEVIEKYRQSPFGKVELSLAVKAGFDYLAVLLSPAVRPSYEDLYPSRVSNCIDLLRDIEASGGGIVLDDDDDNGDDLEDDQGIIPAPDQPPPGTDAICSLSSPTPRPGEK